LEKLRASRWRRHAPQLNKSAAAKQADLRKIKTKIQSWLTHGCDAPSQKGAGAAPSSVNTVFVLRSEKKRRRGRRRCFRPAASEFGLK
jgi:hypothetical protein